MRQRLYIDDNDAYDSYGVFVEDDGLKQVVQPASFKSLTTTDWPEEDGQEVDLSEPVLDSRTLQLQLCILDVSLAEDLFCDLSKSVYHTFHFVDLNKTYTLRLTQNNSFSQLIRLGKLTLTFADDFPETPTSDGFTFSGNGRLEGYEIDDVDLSRFGVYVLEGSEEQVRKAADVKENLKISSSATSGVVYDGSQAVFKPKDVQLNLLIYARDNGVDEFWDCWNALFAQLMKPGYHCLYSKVMNMGYDCYYKSCSVNRFKISRTGSVWCEFALTLTLTSYHPALQYLLLAHEDNSLVAVSLNNISTVIRLRP